MNITDYTGVKDAKVSIEKLSDLLANYQVFYTNVRGFHWHIKGSSFFTLHAKFEDVYNDLAEKIDEIAERILMLGGTPANSFSEYLKVSQVKEVSNVTCGKEAVTQVLETLKVIVAKERETMCAAAEKCDEATSALMSDYVREQEKTIWMLIAYLGDCCKDDACCCSKDETSK
jgi:starvation-inducible DNA-binding protein